eukprot:5537608-Amphidinium_carterae.1
MQDVRWLACMFGFLNHVGIVGWLFVGWLPICICQIEDIILFKSWQLQIVADSSHSALNPMKDNTGKLEYLEARISCVRAMRISYRLLHCPHDKQLHATHMAMRTQSFPAWSSPLTMQLWQRS